LQALIARGLSLAEASLAVDLEDGLPDDLDDVEPTADEQGTPSRTSSATAAWTATRRSDGAAQPLEDQPPDS
jgi:hypothetical protein